ncbi:hypothetical protein Vadar_006298 [Vaccinium darrowii]|uniref:Uncharacterized protein n=1 Tax=Vaccinium darrowii TaxID=229202 RepID=A0ACB7XNK9_9ERIC|nr:hypothetical protein Vadar_006298 [Vaccinium darrowii]
MQDDSTLSRQKKDAESNWKSQLKAWEVAQAPFKNLLMMGFMMWMAGSTVPLFSIGITFSALWQPTSALRGVGKIFEPYKDSKVELLGPKLLFIALNLGGLALGVWKLNTLGLLPTHASDWVLSLPPAQGCCNVISFPLIHTQLSEILHATNEFHNTISNEWVTPNVRSTALPPS